MTLDAINERFSRLSEDDTDLEGTPIASDQFLKDICRILDSRKWLLLEFIELYFEKNLLSLESIFTQFEDILRQANPSINKSNV